MLMNIDPSALKRAFAHYPAGVAALSARVGEEDHVLVASSFTPGVSLEPPLVSVAVKKASKTWPVLRSAPHLGVSLLGAGQGGLCRQLASSDPLLRWSGVERSHVDGTAVRIGGACAWLHCTPYTEHDAGDHVIVLLQVTNFDLSLSVDPLIFHGSRFRDLAPEAAQPSLRAVAA